MKGRITAEYTLWCGKDDCFHWEQNTGKKSHVIEWARSKGWRRTRKYGWICPDCAKGNPVVFRTYPQS